MRRLVCISAAKSQDHCMYHGSSSAACLGGNSYNGCIDPLRREVRETHVYGSYVLAEPDPQKVSAIARQLLEIYRVILARTGLGSDMKLNVIELEDRIGGYVIGATGNFTPP